MRNDKSKIFALKCFFQFTLSPPPRHHKLYFHASQGGSKMFANYILYFLTTYCVFTHFTLTLLLLTAVGYRFLQGLSLLLEAFSCKSEKQGQAAQLSHSVNIDTLIQCIYNFILVGYGHHLLDRNGKLQKNTNKLFYPSNCFS